MTRAELRAACPSNDTGGYIEWLEERVLALTADEEPRKAAERIVQWDLDNPPSEEQLIDAITTAIQAASNAQLERGRKALEAEIAEANKARKREADNYSRIVSDLQAIMDDSRAHNHTQHVREFMEKFGQHIGDTPGFPPQEVLESKLQRVAEEFCELIAACGYKPHVQISDQDGEWVIDDEITAACDTVQDLPHAVREAVDLEYSTHHLMISCGVDTAEPWARVHAANMSKELRDGHPVKPTGWTPPDIAGALREQGWQG